MRLATLAASSHNTQPWKFRLEEQAITILPDYARRCPVVDPDDGHLFKSLDCAAENVVQAAAAQGHAAHVGFDSTERAVRIVMERSRATSASKLFHAIPQRQCTRLRYDGRVIDIAARKALESAGSGESVHVVIIDDASKRDSILDYVREGNLVQLADRAFRKELVTWLRFNDASAIRTGDGLASRTVGQPALPNWLAKPIIGLVLSGKAQARTDESNIRSSPILAAFVAGQDTPEAWIEAGRAYERFALQATALDIRTAFINQPIEVRKLRPLLNGLLGLRHETVLLLLRAGYGPQAPFSLRRPIDDVIISA